MVIKLLKIVVYENKSTTTLYTRDKDLPELDSVRALNKFKKHFKNLYFKGMEIAVTYKEQPKQHTDNGSKEIKN